MYDLKMTFNRLHIAEEFYRKSRLLSAVLNAGIAFNLPSPDLVLVRLQVAVDAKQILNIGHFNIHVVGGVV